MVNGLYLYSPFLVFWPLRASYITGHIHPIHTLIAQPLRTIWGSLFCPRTLRHCWVVGLWFRIKLVVLLFQTYSIAKILLCTVYAYVLSTHLPFLHSIAYPPSLSSHFTQTLYLIIHPSFCWNGGLMLSICVRQWWGSKGKACQSLFTPPSPLQLLSNKTPSLVPLILKV